MTDPAFDKPLPPEWALNEAARLSGFKNWLAVPTLFRTPVNRQIIVNARVMARAKELGQ